MLQMLLYLFPPPLKNQQIFILKKVNGECTELQNDNHLWGNY